MTINYTTLLGLAQPVPGTEANTWGTIVNDSITALVEDSIAGSATASVTSADWTLTTTGSGAANQARAAILIPTGTPGVARSILAPNSSKAYIVDNQSDAAVTLKGATGPTTGVAIAAGTAALAVWDGSDFVLVAQNLANASGTLSAANGGTGLTSPGASGNILTSNGTAWTSAAPAPGGIEYVTKTANYTTQNNEGVLADTSGGAFTVTLPATPSTGDQCVVADAGASFGTNNLTVGRNGSTIGGLAEDLILDISGVSVQFVYDGTTWEVYAQVGGNGGNVVTLDGVQTLTNKTISADSNTISGIAASSFVLSNASGVIDGSAAQKVIPAGVVVGTTDTQTLTNKTLTDPAIIGTVLEDVFTITDGAAFEIDPGNGSIQLITLGANRTPKATNFAAGEAITLMVDDGTAYALTWTDTTFGTGGVIWETDSGVAPTLSTTGYTTIALWKVASQVYGARVGNA